jgi:NNP family nitrate/nitrite transporter-like MFS transporter
VVGAAGGVGGFFLPPLFGGMKWLTGSYGTGFAVFAVVTLFCVTMLWRLKAGWERTFLAPVLPPPAEPVEAPVGAVVASN